MADEKIIQEIRDRFDIAFPIWDGIYEDMLDDLNFVNGDQWPDDLRKDREKDGRPCLTINKVAVFGDQVCGDIRQNEPSIKVKPVDSGSDPDVAEILTGLMRNIEVQSNAEVAYDTAAESAVWCGKGSFRVVTEYADDDTFEQDIRIRRIKNPFTVIWDPASQEWDKSDAQYCFVTERISREKFEDLYPDAAVVDFQGSKDRTWSDEDTVRIAEYFKKDVKSKTLYQMKDPLTNTEMVSDEKLDGWDVMRSRKVKTDKITWYKTNGREILEGPNEWAGKYIPIIEVWGKELNIEGKSVYRGIVRNAKDPQKLYNYSRSQGAEVISLAPKAPYLLSAKMVGQYKAIWDLAHKKNFPYLPFEADPQLPGVIPVRTQPVQVNTGIQAEIMIADQELHDTTGLQQANLGQKSNEKSGKAILARQREGDVANFAYYDNLGRAITYCGKVILDLIPKIYDTARVLRLIKEDGNEDFVPVNQPVQTQGPDGRILEKVFDLTVGKYDVVVTIGPSYTTQREEAADMMIQFINAMPTVAPLIADLVAKNLNFQGSSEIEKRLKAMLPPQVSGGGGGASPPTQPPPPDPAAMAKAQLDHAKVGETLANTKLTWIQVAKEAQGLNEGQAPEE